MPWSGREPASAAGLAGWPSDKLPKLYRPKQPGWLTHQPMAGWIQGGGVGLALSWGFRNGPFCFFSLTVYLRASPLSPGLFVGGANGVSDCREGLQQGERQILKIRRCVCKAGVAVNKTCAEYSYRIIQHWLCHALRRLAQLINISRQETLKLASRVQAGLRATFCALVYAALHYYASQRLLAVNSLHGFLFFSFMVAKTVLLLSWGERHNGLLKRHWYHLLGCPINVMLSPVGIIMWMERLEMRGMGGFRGQHENTLSPLVFA